MRIPAGTLAFRIAVAVAGIVTLGAAASIPFLAGRPEGFSLLRTLPSNTWWFQYADAAPTVSLAAVWRITGAVLAAAFGVAASVRAWSLYRKGGSPLLPFLIAFLLSLSLEGLRAGCALLFAEDGSIAASLFLTRVIYWGRFVGLLSLLIAGLYSVELKYRRINFLVGVVLLVSFAMAAYIPVDRTTFLAQLTWKLGDEQGVWFVNLVLGVLVLATTALAALTRRDMRFLWLAAGAALFLAARELLFFALSHWALLGGLACLGGGAVVCLRTLSVLYRRAGGEAQQPTHP